MKKIRRMQRKTSESDPEPMVMTPGSGSLHSESDSLKELRPMFVHHGSSQFTNDTSLNLNPSISAVESSITNSSSRPDTSLFSSRVSHSTRQSTYQSENSRGTKAKSPQTRNAPFGQPLQILETFEEHNDDDERAPGNAEYLSSPRAIADKLHVLWQDISYISSQYTNSVNTLSSTTMSIINCLQEHVAFMNTVQPRISWFFNAFNNNDVRRILKTYLHFYDNLLQEDAFVKLRLLLCKAFNDLTHTLKSSTHRQPRSASGSMAKPCNYAIGINEGKAHKNEDGIRKIMARIASYGSGVREQNGSFIAPIARGTGKDMNVLCLYFGYRSISDSHSRIAANIQEFYDDVHVIVAKNRIELAAATVAEPPMESFVSQEPTNFVHKFKLPFRLPSDPLRPPISMSLSTEGSARTSGTMGGFIYPIIDREQQPHLQSYANSKFAISCGHVCLDNKGEGSDYPYISSPSAVLISLYRDALASEHDKFSQGNSVWGPDSRVAYSSIISQLDGLFPEKKVKNHHAGSGVPEMRNLPQTRFGQIIWGERTLIQAKNFKDGSLLQDKRLSDLAIIKVNKAIQCDQNYLGDDIAFNEFDPSLMFDNLYVRKIIDLRRYTKESELSSVREVDSMVSTSTRNGDGTYNMNGLSVFKYGSTTKFTRGNINGIKLVYWMDGAIHSSEFVVNSTENTTSFAAGGDSGAWILAKLEDVRGTPNAKGLGVAGMLHSYDGEFRQFGLFTPMTEILERLEEVTKIKWGVVGVPEKVADGDVHEDTSESEGYNSASSKSDSDSEDDGASAYESLVDEQAIPPELD